ncbi:MAG TPA: class I SAM-dependent methyltransferase [Myxococcota bacterium]|nr:class I SAM-dependent methyltransferase [Myxococcota bacterium]
MSLAQDVFWRLHDGLPKQGPGSDASTLRALSLAGPLPSGPRVLDLGCGTGRQSLTLARETGGHVSAVDVWAPSLAVLRERAAAAGLAARIETVQQSMGALDLGARTFDLVWCESAVYTIGFDAALRAWRPLLAPGGALAISELAWLRSEAPPGARRFWAGGYSAMRAHEENLRALEAQGYALLGSFTLPDADWEDGYYTELARRIPAMRTQYQEPEARGVLDATEEEISVFRDREASFAYVFYVVRAGS